VLTRSEQDCVLAVVTSIIGHNLFDDLRKDVSRLALSALRAAGDLAMIVPSLSTPEDPARRRAAIGVLRAALDQGLDPLRSLHEELRNSYGPDQGATIEKLLIGDTLKEGREDDTYKNHFDLLSNEDLGVRELVLDNLRVLTGRDELGLGYDPDYTTRTSLRLGPLGPEGMERPASRPRAATRGRQAVGERNAGTRGPSSGHHVRPTRGPDAARRACGRDPRPR
jgi:hypothetical protein